jgi:hypothetical protein
MFFKFDFVVDSGLGFDFFFQVKPVDFGLFYGRTKSFGSTRSSQNQVKG